MTNNPTDSTFIYDQVPYPSHSFTASHPDRLATLATLLGMIPPPLERCRVLELGCASGGNIIPMAQDLPGSEFVGIDLSWREIADGQAVVDSLGLTNVSLKAMNILDVDAGFGQFDYIITHGIYSWVPPAVQDKILEICKQNLVPNGVAYVSYNTYPGWRLLGTIRDMMLYHTRGIADPHQKVAEARALIEFLAESIPANFNPHSNFLHAYVNFFKEQTLRKVGVDDAYLLHDELAGVNEPLYFYQFAERAAAHGLKYMAEAEFRTMLANSFPDETVQALRQVAKSTIALEQYMDFLRNRTFRQTLLCHQDVRLSAAIEAERMARFYVGSPALPVSAEPDINSSSIEQFRAPDHATLSTDHPVTKAAMLYLARIWPQVVPFETLLAEACACLNEAPRDIAADGRILGANLLKAYGYSDNLVELHVYAPHFVVELSERPVASPVARLNAEKRGPVTNVRHERVRLNEVSYYLLPYLDGSRDRATLLEIMEGWTAQGRIEEEQDGEPAEEAAQARPGSESDRENTPAELLDSVLQQLANAALMVG
jgi:methyltransferase-like protein/SAM-dependent methyltransferase